jgi:hypothetical protein
MGALMCGIGAHCMAMSSVRRARGVELALPPAMLDHHHLEITSWTTGI